MRGVRARSRAATRARVLAVLAALTLALGAAAPFTRWDANPDLLTVEGSPELAAYRDYLAAFGSDELLVIAFEHPHLLGARGPRDDPRAHRPARSSSTGVEDVASLDTAYDVAFGPFGPFAAPLLPDDARRGAAAGRAAGAARARCRWRATAWWTRPGAPRR